jgi:hypothetical protein
MIPIQVKKLSINFVPDCWILLIKYNELSAFIGYKQPE